MGLDQYVYGRKVIKTEKINDTTTQELLEKVDIAYFRKHANLHGWMEDQWNNTHYYRGGDFNCKELVLDKETLEDLLKEHKELEVAEGFFWGETVASDIEKTEVMIKEALKKIEEGYEIIYYAWY